MTAALKTYRAKRNFAITPEPAGGDEAPGEALSFVIQKHWASRLHYDFRLELDGTMKSWAVPKGPSYDTHDKRMAVQVEDHPMSYSSFEGTIPEKQYGAGKVIIWDKGTWQPQAATPDARKALAAGELKFTLHGHKMHGKWVLVRMKGKGDRRSEKQPAWLLIKEKDDYARPAVEFSVVDELPDSVKDKAMPKRKKSAGPPAAPAAKLPASLSPQLATLVDAPPLDAHDWIFELKFDGYRILARCDGKQVALITRNGNDWTHKLPTLHAALQKLGLPPGWYDGEIVVNGADGRPDFGALQRAFDAETTSEILYYLFDVPFFDGHDLRGQPVEARRALLQQLLQSLPTSPLVRFSDALDAAPRQLLAHACKLGLEGVIGKRRGSPYVTRRSGDWIKLKCGQRQEFVIGGYTAPQGAREGIGSLLLGVYDEDGQLRYAGNVGSGFDDTALRDLRRRLDALTVDTSPFTGRAGGVRQPLWVKPRLVAEVRFAQWTSGGAIRHAVFQGLRLDKKPAAIVRERAQPVIKENTMQDNAEPDSALPASFKVSHADRVIDRDSGARKIDLVRYYALVSKLMLVHLRGRPVSLVRAPAGVGGELFFQKHADTSKMPGVKQLAARLDPEHPPMLEVASAQGLLSAAQWNVVEFHTQNALASAYDTPNRLVFDLDPGKGVAWPAIQEAAVLLRAFLTELGLPAWLKTSGGKGLHVVVPIRPKHDWDTVKAFSQAIVAHMAELIPQRFVVKSGPSNRVGKIFIDYLRNGRGATTVCAWSARTRSGLGISVPLGWDELDKLKAGDQWSVGNVHSRLDVGNAPWDGYARSAKGIDAAMKKLAFTPPP
ncbi:MULTISPECIES: DNA ligase D [unclassified Janthinobacterium]|uniref:DNA ligase D n=1 Tax=unclassified Janthinobacterium TaxID=2610881 RepID=UPI000891D389|nr:MULTISPECIES: DNA ligase D [unclassified Janthinobacterium]SDA38692.1 bifunctional non-homologous end joining protein LigD [Janthinobacterium sp. 551a]SFA78426.1 bifunctional non-homologous end joining protein LigD [Janthinobacterium sp. 344]